MMTRYRNQVGRGDRHLDESVKNEPTLICMDDVRPQLVSWLWPGRIASGRLTMLVGRPGEGKSFLTADMAARISRGQEWPDGRPCPVGETIFMSAEDDPGDTLRPRLDALGANATKIHYLSGYTWTDRAGEQQRLITLSDIDMIEDALVDKPDCRLLVIDPIGSYLGAGTDAHRDNEVRGVLAPLAELARKYDTAVLLVAHRRKSSASHADDLAMGSRAFTGIARSVWHLSRDTENRDRRLFLPGKNNLSNEGFGLAFTIGGEPAVLQWEKQPVEMSADDAVAMEENTRRSPGPRPEQQKRAEEWLEKELADGPKLASSLFEIWKTNDGSKRTLQRAKKELSITAVRKEKGWWWRLPVKSATPSKGSEPGTHGTVGETNSTPEPADTDQHDPPEAPMQNRGADKDSSTKNSGAVDSAKSSQVGAVDSTSEAFDQPSHETHDVPGTGSFKEAKMSKMPALDELGDVNQDSPLPSAHLDDGEWGKI